MRKANRPRLSVLITVSLCIIYVNRNALGFFYFKADPGFSWSLYYEDNIANDRHRKAEDFSNHYKPALDFNFSFSRVSLTGKTEIEVIEYFDEKQFNTVDQDHNITASFKLSQRSEFRISAGYRVDSYPDSYFQEEDLSGTGGGFSFRRYKNRTKFGSVALKHSFSERSNLSFRFVLSNFDTLVTDDSNLYYALLDYTSALSRRTTLKVNFVFNYFHFNYDDIIESDIYFPEQIETEDTIERFFDADYEMETYNVSCGLARVFADNLRLNFFIGWRYTETDLTTKTEDLTEIEEEIKGKIISRRKKNSGNDVTFSMSLQKKFSFTNIRLLADQNVGINPNIGGTYERRRFIIDVTHEFPYGLTTWMSLQYNMHKTGRDDEFSYRIDRDYYYITTGISCQFNNWLTFDLNYAHSGRDDNFRRTETRRNTVYFVVNFKMSRPYIFR